MVRTLVCVCVVVTTEYRIVLTYSNTIVHWGAAAGLSY